MPALVELERELRQLKEKQDSLDARLKTETLRPTRPDATLTDILNIENGHTVWARTRRMPMVVRRMADDVTPSLDFLNAVSTNSDFTGRLPTDWVLGTSLTVNVGIYQSATAGSPTAVLRSTIGTNKSGDTVSRTNVENAVNANQTLTQSIMVIVSRTISGSALEAGDGIFWRLNRLGADAGDTVNASVVVGDMGAWIEYTAFM